MSKPVDLYDSHYGRVETDVYRDVRAEAFGEDLGQTSWTTAAECDELARWLELRKGQRLLEIACGSGGVAVHFAQRHGLSAVGLDVNDSAITAAANRARSSAVSDRVEFQRADANDGLSFAADSFDVVFCNDAINHFRDRARVLKEWFRVLRPGGRFLYTDPIVVTGPLSNVEIAARSSIGFFVFTPVGSNEELVRDAGFRLLRTSDLTDAVAATSRRWRDARARRSATLRELEGDGKFEELQRFLEIVHTLSSERRLSRFAFVGEKPRG